MFSSGDEDCYGNKEINPLERKIDLWVEMPNVGLPYVSGLRGVMDKVNFREGFLEIRVSFSMDSSYFQNPRSSMSDFEEAVCG